MNAKEFMLQYWPNGNHQDHELVDIYNIMEAYHHSKKSQLCKEQRQICALNAILSDDDGDISVNEDSILNSQEP